MSQEETHIVCPECGSRYRAASMEPGKRYRCKRCKHVLDLPAGEPTVRLEVVGPEPSIAELLEQGVDLTPDSGSGAAQDPEAQPGPSADPWERDLQQQVRTDVLIAPAPVMPPDPAVDPHRFTEPAASSAPSKPRPKRATLEGVAFGDYEILSEIGRGGMGVVYKARQRGLDRIVAIKTLIPGAGANPETIKRFEREAKAIAKLKHPNIVPIHEYGEFRRTKFIVMDYVEGKSLDRIAKGPGLNSRLAVEMVRDVSLALHFAHSQGIIHRDVKPANVMLDARGVPKIMDFGLAKEMGSQSLISVTGDIMGTPSYMSPEQADGRIHEVGIRSDVYSLGAILYELLTGAPPFEGGSVAQTISQVLNEDPIAPRVRNPKIDPDLETIVLKTLSKESSRRYPTAKALADDLDRYLRGDMVLARPPTILERVSKRVRKSRGRLGFAAAGILALALVVVLAARFTRDELRFFADKLSSRSVEVRASALRALVEEMRQERFERYDLGRAVGLLVRGVSDPDEGIRLLTLQGLAEIPGIREAGAAARAQLERGLAESTSRAHTRPVRLAALDAISELGATGAEPALDTILMDPTDDEEVTLKAIRTTGRVGYFMRSFVPLMTTLTRGGIFRVEAEAAIRRLTEDPKGSGREPKVDENSFSLADTPMIIKRFQRDVARTRMKQLEALQGFAEGQGKEPGEKRPQRPMEVVQEKLSSGDRQQRLQAVFLLSTLKDPNGLDMLFGLLGDGDSLVARSAANAIVAFAGPTVESRLVEKVRTLDGQEVENAAFALGELKSRSALDPLVLALARCRLADARHGIAEALGKIGDKRAVPHLIRALDDTDGSVADAASYALTQISGEDYGRNREKWNVWWQANG